MRPFADKPMTLRDVNPYKPNGDAAGNNCHGHAVRRWPLIVGLCACSYYAASALTLPFVNVIWLGELPPLALIQLPKSFLKSAVHKILMSLLNAFGMSRGSFSPDYIATHDWAMGVMTIAPALLLVACILLLRRVSYHRKLISMVSICASVDGIVTFWFDKTFNLKLFNESYF